MGTWSTPKSISSAERIEELLSKPLPARTAGHALYSVAGNDSLFDLIYLVGEDAPHADVRPIVAMLLDEWVNWTDPDECNEDWDAEARRRVATAAARFRNARISFPSPAIENVDATAIAAMVAEATATEGWEACEVFGGAAYVARNSSEAVYVNTLSGSVYDAPAERVAEAFEALGDAQRP